MLCLFNGLSLTMQSLILTNNRAFKKAENPRISFLKNWENSPSVVVVATLSVLAMFSAEVLFAVAGMLNSTIQVIHMRKTHIFCI